MAKRHPEHMIQKVRSLRSNGWTLGEISAKMKLPKNTISGWVKDIQLTEKQKERIRQKIIDSGAIGRTLAIKVNMKKVERWKEDIRRRVEHLGKFASENPLRRDIKEFVRCNIAIPLCNLNCKQSVKQQ